MKPNRPTPKDTRPQPPPSPPPRDEFMDDPDRTDEYVCLSDADDPTPKDQDVRFFRQDGP